MKKFLLVLFSGFALACVANAGYAQHHMGGFHMGGFHSGAGFHGGHFPNGGFHHFHDGRFHARVSFFVGAPFFWDPMFYPYYYPAPYGPPAEVSWYCPDQGYYPAVQSCPQAWLRVVPY